MSHSRPDAKFMALASAVDLPWSLKFDGLLAEIVAKLISVRDRIAVIFNTHSHLDFIHSGG